MRQRPKAQVTLGRTGCGPVVVELVTSEGTRHEFAFSFAKSAEDWHCFAHDSARCREGLTFLERKLVAEAE